ncbi:hypothetical protein AB4Z54_16085 [Streptomyces sp. MCAF7]
MGALDVWLTVFGMAAPLVLTVPVWGPLLAVVVVVAAWWRLRPTGRHRARWGPLRTRVRAAVRKFADNWPATAGGEVLICADLCPDVSTDIGPDASGCTAGGGR